jgi:hypothetical protein
MAPAGRYRWGGIEVEVFADGHLGLPGTEFLAGAAHIVQFRWQPGQERLSIEATVSGDRVTRPAAARQ